MKTDESANPQAARSHWRWAAVSLVLAAAGTLGSLYLSIGLGLKACPLCFYQRTFMMSIFAVLLIGLVFDRSLSGLLCLVCLPLAVAGLGVAAMHEFLVVVGTLECPPGLFGLGSVPLQSLCVFAVLAVGIALGIERGAVVAVGAIGLGLALAWGCVASSPPLPPAPAAPYDQPPDVCRPPYRPASPRGDSR